jgi:hypothetical protein
LKIDKLLKIVTPFLALIFVLLIAELSFKVFDDYGRVIPYKDYFYNKRMPKSTLKGKPWTKLEFTNTVYRDRNFQHVPQRPDFSNLEQKNIFLLGDSMVESISTPVDKTFYALSDLRNDNIAVVPFHFAGCSLKALTFYMGQYPAFFRRANDSFKPDLAVLQIRPMSYQGGNTMLFDKRIGKTRDFQEKLPVEKPYVVKAKESFLKNFRLDIKFSSKYKDKLFRDLVLGESRIISLLAWQVFQWTTRVTSSAPNHEDFIVNKGQMEELYWQRFEKSVKMLKETSMQQQIPVAVLLVPSPDWLKRFEYTQKLNEQEKRYQELFAKYKIPYHYALSDFLAQKKSTHKEVFLEDNHPNENGVQALSNAFDKLIKKTGV